MNRITGQLKSLERRQICRYMGMGRGEPDAELQSIIDALQPDFLSKVQCKACYTIVPVTVSGSMVDFGVLCADSADLARNLRGCDCAALFAATIGMDTERQKRTASARSPVSGLVLDAMGSAAIEAWCDMLCRDIARQYPQYKARPRFSPGYGDLPLSLQKQMLDVLDAQRMIGVTVTESLLMIPQKSVTAIMGLGQEGCALIDHDCCSCGKMNCEFRL